MNTSLTDKKWQKITYKELSDAVKSSFSVAQAIKKCSPDINYNGSTAYRKFYAKCQEYDISLNHFKGKAHAKGKSLPPKRNLENILSGQNKLSSSNLREILFEEGIKEKRCEKCELKEWLGEPAPLELHHKDGNNKNNIIDNLMILCANCHAIHHKYNPVFRKPTVVKTEEEFLEAIKTSKNTLQALRKLEIRPAAHFYSKVAIIMEKHGLKFDAAPIKNFEESRCSCGKIISNQSEKCSSCYHASQKGVPRPERRKTVRPTKEVLQEELEKNSFLALGKKYGVSGNSIKNWAKDYGIYAK